MMRIAVSFSTYVRNAPEHDAWLELSLLIEVRRNNLPRTPLNTSKKKGRGCYYAPALVSPAVP
jgi:hypothetical protein